MTDKRTEKKTDTNFSNEDLARHFSARSINDADDSACPEPQVLFAAAAGEAPTDVRLEVIDHITDCPNCAEDWRLAIAFAATEHSDNAPTSASPLNPVHTQPRAWFALAAAVVISVGVLMVVEPWDTNTEPVYRGEDPTNSTVQLTEVATLSRDNFELRWTTAVSGLACDVKVFDAAFSTLADQRGIKTGRLRLPASALQQLPKGAQLFWQVTPSSTMDAAATGMVILE